MVSRPRRCPDDSMIKLVPVSALSPGMYLDRMGDSWLDHSFWRTSLLLREPDFWALRRYLESPCR
jgi:hypothetical protein